MITTTHARIEVRTDTDDLVWADISRICSGMVGIVTFTPSWGGGFFLAHEQNNPKKKALIIAPHGKWIGDVTDEGWVIEQVIGDPQSAGVPNASEEEG